ncbi:hypothetical protein B0E54_04520 [Micromonospora sp. MH99]|nr:hypothetical protein [Micromonospora sp. MH99]
MGATRWIGGLATGSRRRRFEQTDTDPNERADEPGERALDAVLLDRRHRVPAGIRLYHHLFGDADRTDQVVREVLEETPFGDDDAERIR